MSQVQYHDPALPDMINKEWRSPLCDEQGRLVTVPAGGSAGGDASAANQVTQIAAEEAIQTAVESIDDKATDANASLAAIDVNTLIATGWFPAASKKYTSMPGGGIDLTTAIPGKRAIAVMGSRTTTNGSVIKLRLKDSDPGELIDLNFGPGYMHYGQWGLIEETSSAGCFPLHVMFV